VEEFVTVICYVTSFIEEDVVITWVLASTVMTTKLCVAFSYTFVAFVGLKCPFQNSSVKLDMLDNTIKPFLQCFIRHSYYLQGSVTSRSWPESAGDIPSLWVIWYEDASS